jgi:hypothetical protein
LNGKLKTAHELIWCSIPTPDPASIIVSVIACSADSHDPAAQAPTINSPLTTPQLP